MLIIEKNICTHFKLSCFSPRHWEHNLGDFLFRRFQDEFEREGYCGYVVRDCLPDDCEIRALLRAEEGLEIC